MNETHVKITLIGKHLAKPRLEFIYEGETPECKGCKLFKVCNNLQRGKRYRITGVRQSTLHTCHVHRDGAYTVEVIESPVMALIGAERAIINSKILFESSCTNTECESYELCNPEGIIDGERYLVGKVIGTSADECKKGKRLKLVELIPA